MAEGELFRRRPGNLGTRCVWGSQFEPRLFHVEHPTRAVRDALKPAAEQVQAIRWTREQRRVSRDADPRLIRQRRIDAAPASAPPYVPRETSCIRSPQDTPILDLLLQCDRSRRARANISQLDYAASANVGGDCNSLEQRNKKPVETG